MAKLISLRSVLVQGKLAYATRRAAAARDRELGLLVLTAPQLAAQLAGGLLRPASRESIEAGIHAALSEPGRLQDLDPVRELPGVTRAVLRTLRNVWRSGLKLEASKYAAHPRVRDLIAIESEVRNHLQPGECLLPDLCRAARERLPFAPRLLGPLVLEQVHSLDPLWRPLVNDLTSVIPVSWNAPAGADTSWFRRPSTPLHTVESRQRGVSCADPAHEALEALRWVRELLASGRAKPLEIAIATTSPDAWDEAMLALRSASDLPLCFVHGCPALATRDGQRCAALADTLLNGLSQARVRRLFSLVAELNDLPRDLPISGAASLSTARDWRRALERAPDAAAVLGPVIDLLAGGPAAAKEAGERLLRGRSQALWDEALRSAPASALMLSLKSMRIPDERDPADAVVWCNADDLAAAPRRFVWLLGLTATNWPRTARLDPILPGFVVPAPLLDPDPIEVADRRSHAIIVGSSEEVVLSSARLGGDKRRQAASPLQPPVKKEDILQRDRAPQHALTEADRLLARPQEAEVAGLGAHARVGWRNWNRRELTAHDGLIGAPHPMLSALLGVKRRRRLTPYRRAILTP